jgi:hypothetical protein
MMIKVSFGPVPPSRIAVRWIGGRCGLDIRFTLGLSEFSERRAGACG